VYVHFFNPCGTGDWWITEGSPEGDDFIMFGLCDLGFPELGYVSPERDAGRARTVRTGR